MSSDLDALIFDAIRGREADRPQDLVGIIGAIDGREKLVLTVEELGGALARLIEAGKIIEAPRHHFYEATRERSAASFSGLTAEEHSAACKRYQQAFRRNYQGLDEANRLDRSGVVPTLRCALLYFFAVFGAGFALGTLRVLFLLPRVGERSAELIEAPLMFGVIALVASWLARRFASTPRAVTGAGPIAAGLVLLADFGVGIGLREMTPAEVVTGRDPVAGAVYYALIVVFALMPAVCVRRRARSAKSGND